MTSIDALTKQASRLETACSKLGARAAGATGLLRSRLGQELVAHERERDHAIADLLSEARSQGLDFVSIPAAGFCLCYTLEDGSWHGFASKVSAAPLPLLYERVTELEFAGDSDSAEHDAIAAEILRRESVSSFDDLEV